MEEGSPNSRLRPRPRRSALLVVDMLNDFLDDQGAFYCGLRAQRIISKVIAAIEDHLKQDWPVVFLQDTHRVEDPKFQSFPEHAIEGTWGQELLPVLVDYTRSESVHVIQKTRYGGFHGTNLDELLDQFAPAVVTVVGICTSISVMDTVKDLWERDYPVRIFKEGVADLDEESHQHALQRIRKLYGAEIV